MQFPESWLRQYCNPPLSTQQLADTLTMAGLEVEELQPVAPSFSGVVVAEIRSVAPHPDAERLRVCQVDVGQDALLEIVCGAPNARAGLRVPCATVGAVLPAPEGEKPFVIKVGKLRGVQSFGMLCSARELGISEEGAGLMELPADAPVGQDIRQYLELDDTLFTLKLTPNLAHCLSVYGIARELAALTGAPLQQPAPASVTVTAPEAKLSVRIDAPELCGRFTGRVVRGVNARACTPQWMVQRLQRCGQRSVSPLVDISNYVMFELGQPSHMFDLDKIEGALEVRWAREGESLKLLNGNTATMPAQPQVGVIADAQRIESLAGIMGGDATAVSDATRNVYIEAAFWYPKAIVGRSRHFNFSTDAGHRFERGVDPSHTIEHIERITQLVVQICGTPETMVGPVDDQQPNMPKPRKVHLRVFRAVKVIGMPLSTQQCHDALVGLGLNVQRLSEPDTAGGDVLQVDVPSHRFDLEREEDLIEEVARMVGYDKLPTTKPLAPTAPRLRAENRRSPHTVRRALAALGYQETINFSFVPAKWEAELAANDQPVRLLNPIASHLDVMRSSLMGSLLQVLKFNLDRRAPRVRVFEIGRVFWRDASVVDSNHSVAGFAQPMRVAALAFGGVDVLQWGTQERRVDFYDIKGDVQSLLAPLQPQFEAATHPALHPGRCARVLLDGREIGFIGELHPRWAQAWELPHAPVLMELELDAVLARAVPAFTSVPRHQSVDRDIALVVAEAITHDAVMQAAYAAAATLTGEVRLRHAVLFDVFRPQPAKEGAVTSNSGLAQGEKSLAIRLTLGSDNASPTDADIDAVVGIITTAIAQATGARLRG